MALNHERVVGILHSEMSRDFVGGWHEDKMNAELIEAKVVARATSPRTFTDWIMAQYFFRLRDGVDRSSFRLRLLEALQIADLTQIPEDLKTRVHNVLYIESSSLITEMFRDNLRTHAVRHYGVPSKNIKFNHLLYPPQDEHKFIALLIKHTGACLHNLSPDNLKTIKSLVTADFGIGQRLIIYKNGDSIGKDREMLYLELAHLGVMVIPKSSQSIEEVFRVILGIV